MAQRLTTEAVMQLYPDDKYIRLLPTVSKFILDDNPMWGIDVVLVKIDPTDESLVYAQKKVYNRSTRDYDATHVSLSKLALDKLAAAGGISAYPSRTDKRDDRMYAEVTAWASLKLPSGEVYQRSATCEWDGGLEEEKTRLECEQYVDKAISKNWENFKNLDDQGRARAIDQRFKGEWIREREYGKRKCESKALNRAIAMILGVPRTFPVEVLRDKTFAVAKFVLVPDMSDPEVKRAVIGAGVQAFGQLYGPGQVSQQPALQSGYVQQAQAALPPARVIDGNSEGPGADAEWDGDPVVVTEGGPGDGGPIGQERPLFSDAELVTTTTAASQPVQAAVHAPAWADVEPYLPHLRSMLAGCQHKDTAAKKVAANAAFKARDAQAISDLYNWALDQQPSSKDGGR
jgi:hypothetical protein